MAINLIFLQNITFSPINKTDSNIEKDIIHIILTNEYWDVPQKDVCMDKNPLGIIVLRYFLLFQNKVCS